MKKIIALLIGLTALTTAGCATVPAFITTMQDASAKSDDGLKAYKEKRWDDAERSITASLEGLDMATKQYADRGNYYLTPEGQTSWDDLQYRIPLGGRGLRAWARLRMKKYEEALEDVNWLISNYNENGCKVKKFEEPCLENIESAVFTRGTIKDSRSDFNGAIEDFSWVVSNGKKLAWTAYENRGVAYLKLEECAKALEHFEYLVEKKPDFAEAYAYQCYTKVKIYVDPRWKEGDAGRISRMAREDPKAMLLETEKDCKKALELDPNNTLAITMIVDIRRKKQHPRQVRTKEQQDAWDALQEAVRKAAEEISEENKAENKGK